MAASVTEPLSRAFEHTGRQLFQPFVFPHWLWLGWIAFLARLAQGGGNYLNYVSNVPPPDDPKAAIEQVKAWVEAHLTLVVVSGLALVLLATALYWLALWVRCRFKFVFLHALAQQGVTIKQAWGEFRVQGNSLMWWLLGFIGVLMPVPLLIFGLGLALAWNDLTHWRWGVGSMSAIVLVVVLTMLLSLVTMIVLLWLEWFIVPMMYHHRVKATKAWRLFRKEVLPGRFGSVVLFHLMQILASLVIAAAAFVVVCVTCCTAALPYVGTVAMLPAIVFARCYSVYFLQELRPDWVIFAPPPRGVVDGLPVAAPVAPPPAGGVG